MERSVVVAVRSVKATQPDRRGICELIANLRAFQIDANFAIVTDFEIELEQSTSAGSEPRSQEEVERADVCQLVFGKGRIVIANAHVSKSVQWKAGIFG